MDALEIVIEHMRDRIPIDFYGRLIVHIKAGKPVHLTEERSIKLKEHPSPSDEDR